VESKFTGSSMNRLWPLVVPELRQFTETEQDTALQSARNTTLDLLEIVGMAAGFLFVTVVTQYALPDYSFLSRLSAAALNFAIAAPLLLVTLGPFHIRRIRRGLRHQLQRRGRG
jgi:hypothetical protein